MQGPVMRRVLEASSVDGAARRGEPVLVRGALADIAGRAEWTFGGLAAFCDEHAPTTAALLQTGVIEQGATPPTVRRSVAEYLRELAALEDERPDPFIGFAVPGAYEAAAPGEPVAIAWDGIGDRRDREYLQLWELFDAVPAVRDLVPIRRLWPRRRELTWGYGFAGPGGTLTGLHSDISNNWFCQMRGSKEFLLFDDAQRDHLAPSRKFDWGSELSDVDIAHLDRLPSDVRDRFASATGWVARIDAGDVLFVPGRTWHAVRARTPSLSLGVFGLRPGQIARDGVPIMTKKLLHRAHLYRWGNCACHETTVHA